jgi:copper transporter 1
MFAFFGLSACFLESNAEAGLGGIPDIDVYSKETKCACGLTKQAPIGCSLQMACADAKSDKEYCAPQSVWNDVCSDDIGDLRKDGVCERYQDACVESTSNECSTGLPGLPKTSEVRKLIKDMCSEMPKMKACKSCSSGDCDEPFTSAFAPLCASMPGMHECTAWKALCQKMQEPLVKKLWKCPQDDTEDPPPMRMFLHFSTVDYILFSWWVPRDYRSYVLACGFCLLFGAASSTLRIFRTRYEAAMSTADDSNKSGEPQWFSPPSLGTNAKRACLLAMVSMIDFLLMLIVMSFNVGLILCCVGGLACGHFMFSHMTPRKSVPSCCCAGE